MIELEATAILNIIDYVKLIYNDFKLLIFLIIGIPLGFWIIENILDILQERFEAKREKEELVEKIERAEERTIFKPFHEYEEAIIRKEKREKLFKEA